MTAHGRTREERVGPHGAGGALGFREGELEGFVEWHKVRK